MESPAITAPATRPDDPARPRPNGATGRVDPQAPGRIVVAAFDAASGFDALKLAPVEPLGSNSVLRGRSAQRPATVRGTDVVADPTVARGLGAARRRCDGNGVVLRQQASEPPTLHIPPVRAGYRRTDAIVAAARAGTPVRADVSDPRDAIPPDMARRLGRRLRRLELTAETIAPIAADGAAYDDGLQLRIDATRTARSSS